MTVSPTANLASLLRIAQRFPVVRHPELKVSTPAHAKYLGWYLEFEFRVTHMRTQATMVGGKWLDKWMGK